MKIALFITIAFVAIMFASVSATIINIPDDYPTIQAGINAASNGDTVLVHSGIYIEHIDFLGKEILITSQEGPDLTIIESQTSGIPIVSFISGETSAAILSGFAVRLSSYAPAVMIRYSSPLIIGNRFMDNDNDWLGGAISSDNGSFPTIKDNIFIGNSAFRGGAVDSGENGESDIRIEQNIFISNTASTHGGAVFIRYSNLSTISRNVFYQNYCSTLGGGTCISTSSNILIYNNTFVSNTNGQPYHGAGITIWYSNGCQIFNNIVVHSDREGIFQAHGSGNTAIYNDCWGNTVDYEGIQPGIGSISVDPLFLDPDNGDFHLQYNSPCIDAGDPNSPSDPDGTIADMGALYYEHYHENKIIFGPLDGDDAGILTVQNGEDIEIEIWVRTDIDNPTPIVGIAHGLISEDSIIASRNGVLIDSDYDVPNWEMVFIDGPFVHNPDDAYPIPEGHTCEVQNALHTVFEPPVGDPLDTQGEWDYYGSFLMTCNTNVSDDNTYYPFSMGWYPHSGQGTIWAFENPPGGGVAPQQDYCGLYFTPEVGINDENKLPKEYSLAQNYPNPFNARTVIEFDLPEPSYVVIEIYDLLGRRVETLVNHVREAGYHEVTWNATDQPSGIYFYKIEADDFADTKKMLLLK